MRTDGRKQNRLRVDTFVVDSSNIHCSNVKNSLISSVTVGEILKMCFCRGVLSRA